MDILKESLKLHSDNRGKLAVRSKVSIKNKKDLSLAYTPGVAEVSRKIFENRETLYKYCIKSNSVAVISDGSAVLGLGNIGGGASLPVMEGKAVLFKEFADIDAYPIILEEQDIDRTVETIKNISGGFGGINLEDFKAPECFTIESRLQDLGIPVMHDDQHGTAVVVLAGLINSIKLAQKGKDVKIVINGAGAAGVAIAKLLYNYGFRNLILIDSRGIINEKRENLNSIKKELARITNGEELDGGLKEALKNADVFIGVSKPNLLNEKLIRSMNPLPIIFAMANPDPEIMPDKARRAGAFIVATGRSDFPNQVNNVLAFPGIFRGALDVRAKRITEEMKVAAAEALSKVVEPRADKILPDVFDKNVVSAIAEAVKKAYKD
jgi:malate dehydrogenase (oxaloacetate-decarboxylating)